VPYGLTDMGSSRQGSSCFPITAIVCSRAEREPPMNEVQTIFLQIVVLLIGIAALAFLLWEPHVEGVNKHATLFEMYFSSFVAYAYIGSIPFFAALYQTFKLLGYARQIRCSRQRP